MQDDCTTQAQLAHELAKLRQRVAELEAAEAERKQMEAALRAEFVAAILSRFHGLQGHYSPGSAMTSSKSSNRGTIGGSHEQ